MWPPTCLDDPAHKAHAHHRRAQGVGTVLAGNIAFDKLPQFPVTFDGQAAAHFRDRGNLFREMVFHLRGQVGGDSLVPTGCREFKDICGLQRPSPC
jgi:hypothetical protein